ncbi:MAG: succinate dehydrogenase/fumarate reductase iron-sulfur subunit [Candidatus Marsarchaeota archaeon]|nr:succinate dehydrogenase/fumarate reductase iron-sulfur subunit [Candidatus Marsarchaeota archaeon]MCL5094581.1 succinate dehydrogenase/fumarate reductase iron-sulfur subunit [Candidatus Marsarchaeota archaeon]
MNKIIKIYKSQENKFKEFEVPIQEGMVVLDAVIYILEHFDSTISVRWNCKAARCGSCGAEINGLPKLMCKTRIDSIKEDIEIKPLKIFKNVQDIVVDVSDTWEIKKKMPGFEIINKFSNKNISTKEMKIYEIDVERAQEFKKCIECFLCLDSCHVIREHKTNYIGPMHVVKTASFDMNPIDKKIRIDFLDKNGIRYCNVTKCCTEVCPAHIKITDNAIIPEKERINDKKIL